MIEITTSNSMSVKPPIPGRSLGFWNERGMNGSGATTFDIRTRGRANTPV